MQNKTLICVLIFYVGSIIYSNSFQVPFSLDDYSMIVYNPIIKNFQDIRGIFRFDPTRFITHLSFALQYHYHGLRVFWYHLVNLILHCFNAYLCYILVQLTLKLPRTGEFPTLKYASWIPFFGALIFLAHPIQTQAVIYIVQRSVLLAILCYFLALILFIRLRLQFKWMTYVLVWLVILLGAMTKPIIVSLPLMIFLYECYFFDWSWKYFKKNFYLYLPYLILLLIVPFFLMCHMLNYLSEPFDLSKLTYASRMTGEISRGQYLLTESRVILTYLRLLWLPINQSFDYSYPLSKGLFNWNTLGSLLGIFPLLYGVFFFYKRNRWLSFSLGWFFISLVVESSIFPLPDVIFEHRLYMAVVGFAFFVCCLFSFAINTQRLYIFCFLVIILSYSILTYSRNLIWADPIGSAQDALKKAPHKARLHNHLGWLYQSKKLFTLAEIEYTKALNLDNNDPQYYLSLADLYSQQAKYLEAIEQTKKALRLRPGLVNVQIKLEELYYLSGQSNKPLRSLRK